MPKADSSLNMLIVAAVVALGIGYYVPQTFSQKAARAQPKAETPKAAIPRLHGPPRRRGVSSPWAARSACPLRRRAASPRCWSGSTTRWRPATSWCGWRTRSWWRACTRRGPRSAVRKRDRDNETVAKAAQDRSDRRGQVRQCRAPAGVRARGTRPRAEGAAQRDDQPPPTSTRRAMPSRKANDAARAGAHQPAQGHGSRRAGADPARGGAGRRPGRAVARRGGARAHAHPGALRRHGPADQCQGRRDGGAFAREPAGRRRRCHLAARAGRVRGARHRQGARRPERGRALRRFPGQGLRGQGVLAGSGAGAEQARPARPAPADRYRRAGGASSISRASRRCCPACAWTCS